MPGGKVPGKVEIENMQIARDAQACNSNVDPRYIFLVRASARLWLVDNCEMTLDQAFDGLIETLSCPCSREMVERWERDYPPVRRLRNRRAA
jgi:hypothetical protein